MDVVHIGLVHFYFCGCKVKIFLAISSFEKIVQTNTCKDCNNFSYKELGWSKIGPLIVTTNNVPSISNALSYPFTLRW